MAYGRSLVFPIPQVQIGFIHHSVKTAGLYFQHALETLRHWSLWNKPSEDISLQDFIAFC